MEGVDVPLGIRQALQLRQLVPLGLEHYLLGVRLAVALCCVVLYFG